MNLRKSPFLFAVGLAGGVLVADAFASTINCNDSYRTASLSSANACYAQTLGSTAKVADVNAITGGDWTKVSELTASGTNGWFSVAGSGWGKASAAGSWSISDLFWDNFTSALITMHVGGGQKDAVDNFEWLITSATDLGSWSYAKLNGKGGGLSNIKLWGMGTPVKAEPTPEPTPTPGPTPQPTPDPVPPVITPDPLPPATTTPDPLPPVATPEPAPVPTIDPLPGDDPVTPPQDPAPLHPVTVPEPSPFLLILLGMAFIVLIRRTSRN